MPGLGQIYLKYYWRGMIFAISTLVCLSLIIAKITQIIYQAMNILIKESNGIIILQDIVPIMTRVLKNHNLFFYHILEVVMVLSWIWSSIDAYILAKNQPIETNKK
jgi:hypothetical protein